MKIQDLLKYTNEINEYGVGRIVPGVNTTKDVKWDHIKTSAAKFGFDISPDGYAPSLLDAHRRLFLNKKSK